MSLNAKVDFKKIIRDVKLASNEAEIRTGFAIPLLNYIGYSDEEIRQEKVSGEKKGKIDFSCNSTKKLPSIFLETKSPNQSIINSKSGYESVVSYTYKIDQISKYINENPIKYRFGIITNGKSVAIYRNYFGNAVQVLKETVIDEKNIGKVFLTVKSIISKSRDREPVIISIFINKGGVGKTTISYYFSKTLSSKYNKKVLAMDFDPLQGDLSRLLKLDTNKYLPLIEWITLGKKELLSRIRESGKKGIFPKSKNLHCVYADTDENYKKYTKQSASITKIRDYSKKIRGVLKSGFSEISAYDFVIIDTPPGWWFYSMLANAISDLVIIPVSTTSESSWLNSIRYLKDYLPDLKEDLNNRAESGPTPLPFLYNQVQTKINNPKSPIFQYKRTHGFLKEKINELDKDLSYILKNMLFVEKQAKDGSFFSDHPSLSYDNQIQETEISKEEPKKSFSLNIENAFSQIIEFYFPELKER